MCLKEYLSIIYKINNLNSTYKILLPKRIRIVGFGGYYTDFKMKIDSNYPNNYNDIVYHLFNKYSSCKDLKILDNNFVIGREFEESFTKFHIPSLLFENNLWVNNKDNPKIFITPVKNSLSDVYKLI
jgi:hypothetical protein